MHGWLCLQITTYIKRASKAHDFIKEFNAVKRVREGPVAHPQDTRSTLSFSLSLSSNVDCYLLFFHFAHPHPHPQPHRICSMFMLVLVGSPLCLAQSHLCLSLKPVTCPLLQNLMLLLHVHVHVALPTFLPKLFESSTCTTSLSPFIIKGFNS